LEQLLEGLEPAVNREERFIVQFFHVEAVASLSPNSPSKSTTCSELRRLMGDLFCSIESELIAFLTQYEKLEAR